MMLANEIRREIKGMKKGELFYINAIGLSIAGVNLLRAYVRDGVITPIRSEVESLYNDIESVMCGDVILPQMNYIKN